MDEMDEVDFSKQVKEDELKEDEDVKYEMMEKMVKEEVPKGKTWIGWWKKLWKVPTTLKQKYIQTKTRPPGLSQPRFQMKQTAD